MKSFFIYLFYPRFSSSNVECDGKKEGRMIIMDKNENEKQFIDKKEKRGERERERRERKEGREEVEGETDVGETEKSRTSHRNRLMH
jgi:hypothetical protein